MTGETTAPAGTDNPQPALPPRTCRKCGETKAISPETWPYRKNRHGRYEVTGNLCRACDIKRKSEYEARRGSIAALVNEVPVPKEGTPEQKRKAIATASKLDVAQALKAGSIALNQFAPGAMARLAEYLEDPEHPHHQWALEFVLQRILPRKLYEELGGQAAGVGTLRDRPPMFVLNVLPAGQQPGNVYDQEGRVQLVGPVTDVEPEPDAG